MLRLMRIPVWLSVFLAVACAGCGGGSGSDAASEGERGDHGCRIRSVDEAAWVGANNRVLETIPVYPGATELATYSIGNPAPDQCLPLENSPPYDSFWTYHTFTLPPGTGAEQVLDFYHEQLAADWKPVVVGPGCEVSYRRGQVLLGVSACNGTLRLALNHTAHQ
jgi:hypothetical protein